MRRTERSAVWSRGRAAKHLPGPEALAELRPMIPGRKVRFRGGRLVLLIRPTPVPNDRSGLSFGWSSRFPCPLSFGILSDCAVSAVPLSSAYSVVALTGPNRQDSPRGGIAVVA